MGDYYRVLGVNPGASQDEIKVAFRKLALLHHPDRHAGATEAKQAESASKFKAITEAYDVLTDDRKRTQYEASVRSRSSGGGGGGSSSSSAGGGQWYGSQHNVNTDWTRSSYKHE
ncbi:hypothetical protein Agub_g12449, partial [Astrephomene gubernaculifera]